MPAYTWPVLHTGDQRRFVTEAAVAYLMITASTDSLFTDSRPETGQNQHQLNLLCNLRLFISAGFSPAKIFTPSYFLFIFLNT